MPFTEPIHIAQGLVYICPLLPDKATIFIARMQNIQETLDLKQAAGTSDAFSLQQKEWSLSQAS